jgi:hypothetical protein
MEQVVFFTYILLIAHFTLDMVQQIGQIRALGKKNSYPHTSLLYYLHCT